MTSPQRTLDEAAGPVIDSIDRALEATATIVDGITADQWTLPTPCTAWDVRTVTNHLVGGMRIFTAEIRGETASDHEQTDWLGPDPAAAYHAAAAQDAAAWRAPGAVERNFSLSLGPVPGPLAAVIHLTEVAVHGLDLAVATGQEAAVDTQLAESLLALMKDMGTMDSFRVPGVFGPEVPVPSGAPAHARLLAYLGRTL